MDSVAGLREQKKLKSREALVDAALSLFEAQGFEATTVDAITGRAGVSRRSFFRYFSSKESVVFAEHPARLSRFKVALTRLIEGGTTGFQAVRAACLAIAHEYMSERREMARQHLLVATSPALIVHELTLDHQVEIAIAEALCGPTLRGQCERRARLLAAATMGVVRVTLTEWYALGCRPDLVRLGAEALDLLEPGFEGTKRRVLTRPARVRRARTPRARSKVPER